MTFDNSEKLIKKTQNNKIQKKNLKKQVLFKIKKQRISRKSYVVETTRNVNKIQEKSKKLEIKIVNIWQHLIVQNQNILKIQRF